MTGEELTENGPTNEEIVKHPSKDQDLIGAPDYMKTPGHNAPIQGQKDGDPRTPPAEPDDLTEIIKEDTDGHREALGKSIEKQAAKEK